MSGPAGAFSRHAPERLISSYVQFSANAAYARADTGLGVHLRDKIRPLHSFAQHLGLFEKGAAEEAPSCRGHDEGVAEAGHPAVTDSGIPRAGTEPETIRAAVTSLYRPSNDGLLTGAGDAAGRRCLRHLRQRQAVGRKRFNSRVKGENCPSPRKPSR